MQVRFCTLALIVVVVDGFVMRAVALQRGVNKAVGPASLRAGSDAAPATQDFGRLTDKKSLISSAMQRSIVAAAVWWRKTLLGFAAEGLSRNLARLLLVGCSMTYGYGYVNTKQLQQLLDPSIVTALRFVLAALVFLPSIVSNWKYANADTIRGGVELGTLCAIGFISQGASLQNTSASKVAFFCGLSVIMPPLFGVIEGLLDCWRRRTHFKQRLPACSPCPTELQLEALSLLAGRGTGQAPDRGNSSSSRTLVPWIDFATNPLVPPLIALIGAGILEWGSLETPHVRDLMLLITPLSFSFCFWRSERLTRNAPAATAFVTGLMLLTCAVISSLAALASGAIPLNMAGLAALGAKLNTRSSLVSLAYQGLLATAVTSYVEQSALKVLSAADTTLIYSLEPIFASTFAAVLLREHLGVTSYVSAVFIISACLYNTLAKMVLRTVLGKTKQKL